jgi:Golgi phosphoprotein 3 GPP34
MSGDPAVMVSRQRGGGRVQAPSLGGTGRLADDLFLMAHNDVTGKPLLQPRAPGLGLAGALRAELILSGRLWVRPPHPPGQRTHRETDRHAAGL